MPCRLIVNADDFGQTEAINRGIVRACREGIVTSATLMASGPAFHHAVALARETPQLDLGVHLTLTHERPLSDPGLLPSLVTDEGVFPQSIGALALRFLRGAVDSRELKLELEAQLARAADSGLALSHIDGHQHIHAFPAVRAVARELAPRFGIELARMPYEPIRASWLANPSHWPRIAQLAILNAVARAGDWGGLRTPNQLAGFLHGGSIDFANLCATLDTLPDGGVCELMCHPGEEELDRWGYRRRDELDALVDPRIAALLGERGVTRIAFGDLA